MQHDIGRRMQEQAELVGKKAVTGGTVAPGIGLVLLDVELVIASKAVNLFVKRLGLCLQQVGADESDIQAFVGHFHLGNHLACFTPALGLIPEGMVAAVAWFLLFYLVDDGLDIPVQDFIAPKAGHAIAVLLLCKEGKEFRHTVMAVAPIDNDGLRPLLADMVNDTLHV